MTACATRGADVVHTNRNARTQNDNDISVLLGPDIEVVVSGMGSFELCPSAIVADALTASRFPTQWASR
jgi:hypothetical protein